MFWSTMQNYSNTSYKMTEADFEEKVLRIDGAFNMASISLETDGNRKVLSLIYRLCWFDRKYWSSYSALS